MTSPAPAPGENRRPRQTMTILTLDIALPLAAFYALHGLGTSDWAAMLAATAAAGARLVWEAIRNHMVTWFAAIMLAVFGTGAALAAVGGDARVLLLKDSATTAMIGAVFLVSLFGERPLTLSAAQTWRPAQAERLARLYRAEPAARHAFRVSAFGWGAGLLGESLARVPLIFLLPLDVMVGLSTAMMIAAMTALAIWNGVYISLAAKRTPALSILLPARTR